MVAARLSGAEGLARAITMIGCKDSIICLYQAGIMSKSEMEVFKKRIIAEMDHLEKEACRHLEERGMTKDQIESFLSNTLQNP